MSDGTHARPGALEPADPAQAERLHLFAHGIRNRLAGMQQALLHLSKEPQGDSAQELAVFGEQQFFKALQEVEDLLDDLGVDRDPAPGVRQALAFDQVVRVAIADLDHRFQRKEQRVMQAMPGNVMVHGNVDQLSRCTEALLTNASKFAPSGSTIHVALTIFSDHALLTVRDEGVGLSTADLARVFERYAWLDSTPTSGEAQGRSTLARVRRLVQAHDGDLTAHSDGLGTGCTFTLRLPLVGG